MRRSACAALRTLIKPVAFYRAYYQPSLSARNYTLYYHQPNNLSMSDLASKSKAADRALRNAANPALNTPPKPKDPADVQEPHTIGPLKSKPPFILFLFV